MEITDKEIKELWEKCGFNIHPTQFVFPVIDLNNLFRWAVPLAVDKIMVEQDCSSELAYAILFKKWLQQLELNIPHATDSLFRALQEVLK